MNKSLTIKPISYVQGKIDLPGSKSISNRVLLMSALAHGKTSLINLLDSYDTQYMLLALKDLGIHYVLEKNKSICHMYGNGINFKNNKKSSIFLGNAGTAIRSLVAVLSLVNNDFIITGDKRMQERPIGDLIDCLKQGGAKIKYMKKEGFPPIHTKGGFIGGNISIRGNISSQFLSALLIASPLAINDTTITVTNKLVSIPYIRMTLKIIQHFGIKIKHENYKKFYITGQQTYLSPRLYYIESDLSSATYFLAAAAIKGKNIVLNNIYKNSIQGDIRFIHILQKMGAIIFWGENFVKCSKGKLHGIDMDMNDIPDAAMTIAIVALFSHGTTTIRNIYNWRVKETDRLHAMSTELKKVGAIIVEGEDYISITPPKKFIPSSINTYNDHRMAMCFSLIPLSEKSVNIINPDCVAKTFPNYFSAFNSISFYN
ncbi:3-phosphoshikimate 1-carboxyvinyltransferase [Buchnera aphidicola]|uniref:3-phosphoshikimate 1-carboxyvinyltransferase n=1 Tax=Buchnera aphidicola (Anoecia oenotherae) TaxID=1241833 RepID=A0A4D6XV50_9GAMM|nr:3-phosphoshikimate 1-carboxyvinyltransferase [Buchnera aphidicola]QCI19369.1 3-phosphoshikimate 1-carboxyvinyltransferase [Buchnera aphidicola (Anoecia oenotherae)]